MFLLLVNPSSSLVSRTNSNEELCYTLGSIEALDVFGIALRNLSHEYAREGASGGQTETSSPWHLSATWLLTANA